jgi:anti-anti-sigma factor
LNDQSVSLEEAGPAGSRSIAQVDPRNRRIEPETSPRRPGAGGVRQTAASQGSRKGMSMDLFVMPLDDILVVRVSGAVDRLAAGRLYDVLIKTITDRRAKLIVDLSDVYLMTRAGARGLIVAAKLLQSGGGEMRIAGAKRSIEAFLQDLGFTHLLICEPNLGAAMMALSRGSSETMRAMAAPAADVSIDPQRYSLNEHEVM